MECSSNIGQTRIALFFLGSRAKKEAAPNAAWWEKLCGKEITHYGDENRRVNNKFLSNFWIKIEEMAIIITAELYFVPFCQLL